MEVTDVERGLDDKVCKKTNRVLLTVRTVFHGLVLCHHVGVDAYGGVIFFKAINSDNFEIRNMGYYAAALGTNWNFTFQTIFMFMSLISDVYEWRGQQDTPRPKTIAYWKEIIYKSLVVPYTLFVSSMFWSVYFVDRELVFPKVYDSIVPWWFNHCVHTNITLLVLVETVLTPRRHPTNQKVELILTSIVAVAYAIVYYSIYYFANRWLYNVFGVMTWWQVCLYQLLIWSSSYIFYFIQFPIGRLIHGPEEAQEKTIIERVENKEETEPKVDTAVIEKKGSHIAKNFEIAAMQKDQDMIDAPFSSDNWSLKYRSLREKFENSRL